MQEKHCRYAWFLHKGCVPKHQSGDVKVPQLEGCIVRQELVSGVYLKNAFHVVKDIPQAKDDLQIRIGVSM
jgi:hypothetical protein